MGKVGLGVGVGWGWVWLVKVNNMCTPNGPHPPSRNLRPHRTPPNRPISVPPPDAGPKTSRTWDPMNIYGGRCEDPQYRPENGGRVDAEVGGFIPFL